MLLMLLLDTFGQESTKLPQLGGPLVTKVDWNCRSLCTADINGDGRLDIAMINNDRVRIELLIQSEHAKSTTSQDGPDDGWFEKRHIVTGSPQLSIVAADLNRDGRVDLVSTSPNRGLEIRYQKRGDSWRQPIAIDFKSVTGLAGTLAAADLDDDGSVDIVLLTATALHILSNTNDALNQANSFAMPKGEYFGLVVRDLTGDGLRDIAYLEDNSSHSLHLRPQLEAGVWGPETRLQLETPYGNVVPINLGDRGTGLVSVHQRADVAEFFRIDVESDPKTPSLSPSIFASRPGEGRATYCMGDINDDGRLDIAVCRGDQPNIEIYLQNELGQFSAPLSFPTYIGVNQIASGDTDGDGKQEIIFSSAREKTLGISRFNRAQRLTYPKPIPLEGVPYGVVAMDVDGDGVDELAFVEKKDRERSLVLLRRAADGWARDTLRLEDLKTDPRALKALDVDGDGRSDIAIFALQEPVRLVLTGQEKMELLSQDKGFQKGLINNLDSAQFVSARGSIISCDDDFARAIVLNDRARLEVVDQYNAGDSQANLDTAALLDIDGDETPEALLLDGKKGRLYVLHRNRRDVFEVTQTSQLGEIDVTDAWVLDLDQSGHPDWLVLGQDQFWWIRPDASEYRLNRITSFESAREKMRLTHQAVGDLNGDGLQDVVLIDSMDTRQLEVLTQSVAGDFSSRMFFTVFETDPHYRGREGTNHEPKACVIDDMTGDGLDDLVLLVHDRILVYPQQ